MTEYSYRKLDVWEKAVNFAVDILSLGTDMPGNTGDLHLVRDLESSSTVIATAIAQGKAYVSQQDFVNHLYLARGAVYKSMTLLEILRRKQMVSNDRYAGLDAAAQPLTGMLSGLIKSVNNPKAANHDGQSSQWREKKH